MLTMPLGYRLRSHRGQRYNAVCLINTTQDEAGPITCSVADAVRMSDVMAAYDPDDPITIIGQRQKPRSDASLDRAGLCGPRVGLVTGLLGTEAIHTEVI